MKKILSTAEHFNQSMVTRLQRLNIYKAMVAKLSDGETVSSVSRWAMTCSVEGTPGSWSFWMWWKAVAALRHQVREAKDKMWNEESRRRRTVAPVRPAHDAVLMKVNQMVADKELRDFIPKSAHEVFQHVMAAEKRLKAIHLLTYEAIKQVGRIERMTELESKMPFMMPNGANEIAKLTDISAQMMRYELGVEMLRGKYGMLPQVGVAADAELPPMAKELLQFDEVDRSILREVVVRTIDLARGKIDGRFEAVRLETNGSGTGTETGGDSSGTPEASDATRSSTLL